MAEPMKTAAGFSDCRQYRYWLTRTWDEARAPLAVIGLNPSTADETQDDPTIRRCLDFARRWDHGGLVMLNLFAWRSTDPTGLRRAFDAVGPANDATLRVATEGRRVLCAWGAHGTYLARSAVVMELLAGRDLVCLARTQAGQPKHPLYLRADSVPVPFGRAESTAHPAAPGARGA